MHPNQTLPVQSTSVNKLTPGHCRLFSVLCLDGHVDALAPADYNSTYVGSEAKPLCDKTKERETVKSINGYAW